MKFSKNEFKRFSKQIILKDIGIAGQKKIFSSKVLVIGVGGLGCPLILYLANSGIGNIGIADHDKVEISNLNRQILFTPDDLGKLKVTQAKKRIYQINKRIKVSIFSNKINKKNINKIINKFDIICDGTDNFETRYLINDYCLKNKKILISGAISRFEGQVYTFNFHKKKSPCLRCFIPDMPSRDQDIDNCEFEGILGTLGGIIGTIQANEVIKEILQIGESLCGNVLIIDGLKLTFRKVKLNKRSDCFCNE